MSLAALIMVLLVTPAIAQTGAVVGRVICDDGNVPARGAYVDLVPLAMLLPQSAGVKQGAKHSYETSTDFSGSYVIPLVQAGTYLVYASQPGYSSDFELVRAVLGRFTLDEQRKLLSNFPQVNVNAGGTARQDVIIYRGGAITGRVTVDIGGTPGDAEVTATMVSSKLLNDLNDSAEKKPLDFAMSGKTDDRGVYRIAGLPAGTYRIGIHVKEEFNYVIPVADLGHGTFAIAPARTGTASVTIFAPSSLTQSDAQLVSVDDGDELSNVDITIPISLLHSIAGTVTQGGVPMARADVMIFRQGKRVTDSDALTTLDGSYRFDLLPAGTYTIQATVLPYGVMVNHRAVSSERYPVGKVTVQLGDGDLLDANIGVPTTVSATSAKASQ